MAATDALKHTPKWAWFTVGGIGLGALAIRVWKDRATEDTPTSEVDTVGTPSAGIAPSSPTPIITPPVIIGGGDSGDNGALTQMLATMGGSFDTLTGSLASLAAGSQSNTDTALGQTGSIATGAIGTIGEIATSILAGGGGAPAPILVNPTPVYVNITNPAPTGPAVPVKSTPNCPASHPNRSSKGCYRCYKENGKWTHVYADGKTPTSRGNSQC